MYLDITINNHRYTQRNEYSKIVEVNLKTNEKNTYDSLLELPHKTYEELCDKLKIEANPLKYFRYKETYGGIEITNFLDYEDLNTLHIPSQINGQNVIKVSIKHRKNNLEKIVFPDTVQDIERCDFSFSKKLKEVVLSANISTIGTEFLMCCSNLQKINLDNIEAIHESAFSECENLEEANLSNVALIDGFAFAGCEKIKHISLPNVKSIKHCAFIDCKSLESVELSNKLINIGSEAFCKCINLSKINLPNTLGEILGRTFYGCSLLKTINIPNKLVSIGKEAFSQSGLCGDISFPDSLILIKDKSFHGCKFDKIKVSNNTKIEYQAFDLDETLKINKERNIKTESNKEIER